MAALHSRLSLTSSLTMMHHSRVTCHAHPVSVTCMRLVCAQAVIVLRLGSNGSHFTANSTRRTFASTDTGRPHAQLYRIAPARVFASSSEAAGAAPAPQSATELCATPPESEAAQFPLSAAVVAAAAAALVAGRDRLAAAGRDLLAAAEAVDEFPVVLTLLAQAGSSVWAMLSLAPIDPLLVLIGCVGFATGVLLFYGIRGPDRDSPRSAAVNTACRTYWVWRLAWHLTGAFLPV